MSYCELPLPDGRVALIDEEDYEYCYDFRWRVTKIKGVESVYATIANGTKKILLHRFVMQEHNPEIYICAIDKNLLDCRKINLERRTWSQVMTSRKEGPVRTTTTGYRGVTFDKKTKKYRALIKKNRVCIALGSFDTAVEAAKAYDKKALELFGDKYGKINFKDRAEGE